MYKRQDYDSAAYRETARNWVEKFTRLPFRPADFQAFAGKIDYYRMDFSDHEAYRGLNRYYAGNRIGSHIFYFAVAPRFFSVITEGLKLVDGAKNGKVIIEKPFGEDLAAAKTLNGELEDYFGPEQIYRIDHYLGKEMVRNIQAIRFTNPIFTDIWNSGHIESVQISALEDMGAVSYTHLAGVEFDENPDIQSFIDKLGLSLIHISSRRYIKLISLLQFCSMEREE